MVGMRENRLQGGDGESVNTAPRGAIRVRGLCRSFGEQRALAPTDLDIGPGGITGLLGPNGSGKSTLMRAILGLVPADAGSAWVDGVPLTGDGVAIRRRCTFSPGELSLYGRMRARDQLDWLLAGRGAEACQRARQLAEDLELPLRQRVRTYSHGMKRQLLLAAAMAPRVPVRLLDEITEGLDPAKRGVVLQMLREDERRGTAILLSSHHLGEVQRVCDHMIFMGNGQVLSEESAQTVLGRSRRIVHLHFEADTSLAELERVAHAAGVSEVRGEARRYVLHLPEEDLRPTLRRLLADPAFPRPLKLEYGALSLEDLYKDLYGEDAC
jgi:ABC-2 type transport system ATP-binding protein